VRYQIFYITLQCGRTGRDVVMLHMSKQISPLSTIKTVENSHMVLVWYGFRFRFNNWPNTRRSNRTTP